MRRLVALIAALTLIAASCGNETGGTTTSFKIDPDPANCITSPGLSLENCFTRETMHQFNTALFLDVYTFYTKAYAANAGSQSWIDSIGFRTVLPGEQLEIGCVDHTGAIAVVDSTAALYCSEDLMIYLGVDSMWGFYADLTFGDFAAAYVVAHEWAHAIQHGLGILDEPLKTPEIFRPVTHRSVENQADCMAGAWARSAANGNRLEQDDVTEASTLARVLGAVAEANLGFKRHHGNADERSSALLLGMDQGLDGCEIYFPEYDFPPTRLLVN